MDISFTPETPWKPCAEGKERNKIGATTGKRKPIKTTPIEKSRNSAWHNCPSYNFSDFDNFDLVVETSSESKTKKGDSPQGNDLVSKTPHSSKSENDGVFQSDVLKIPEIPKINLHATNAFSTSFVDKSLSLPNSPAIEGYVVPNRDSIRYIHTSSPRVDCGFEADRSQSYNSSTDKCLSSANGTPLADISGISNIATETSILQTSSIDDMSHMPSIDENSTSDFSSLPKQRPNVEKRTVRGTIGSHSGKESRNHSSCVDVSGNKELDDIVKLAEQLSLISAAENSKSGPLPDNQTPVRYRTRHFVKSTKKEKALKGDISKMSSVSSAGPESLFRKIVTRSVTKSANVEGSYDASQ